MWYCYTVYAKFNLPTEEKQPLNITRLEQAWGMATSNMNMKYVELCKWKCTHLFFVFRMERDLNHMRFMDLNVTVLMNQINHITDYQNNLPYLLCSCPRWLVFHLVRHWQVIWKHCRKKPNNRIILGSDTLGKKQKQNKTQNLCYMQTNKSQPHFRVMSNDK